MMSLTRRALGRAMKPPAVGAGRLTTAVQVADALVVIVRQVDDILTRRRLLQDLMQRSASDAADCEELFRFLDEFGDRMSDAGLNSALQEFLDHEDRCRKRRRDWIRQLL